MWLEKNFACKWIGTTNTFFKGYQRDRFRALHIWFQFFRWFRIVDGQFEIKSETAILWIFYTVQIQFTFSLQNHQIFNRRNSLKHCRSVKGASFFRDKVRKCRVFRSFTKPPWNSKVIKKNALNYLESHCKSLRLKTAKRNLEDKTNTNNSAPGNMH